MVPMTPFLGSWLMDYIGYNATINGVGNNNKYPANTKHLYNIYTMLAQRLRR